MYNSIVIDMFQVQDTNFKKNITWKEKHYIVKLLTDGESMLETATTLNRDKRKKIEKEIEDYIMVIIRKTDI